MGLFRRKFYQPQSVTMAKGKMLPAVQIPYELKTDYKPNVEDRAV